MRDLLTYFGLALILLLSVLLAAPLILDFDAYRVRIAEELASSTGAQVSLGGPIALRLLPSPRFSAQDFGASGAFGAVRAKKAFFELALPALMQGKLQFSRAELDDSQISLEADALRRLQAGSAQFDRFILRRARIFLLHGGAPLARLDSLDLDAEILSLAGPFHGRGAFMFGGEKIAMTLAAESPEKTGLPIKIALAAPDEAGKLQIDGEIIGGADPHFDGAAKFSGVSAPGVWQGEANVKADFSGLTWEALSGRLGEGPLADKPAGSARYDWRSGQWAVDLTAPHLGGGWAEALVAHFSSANDAGSRLAAHLAIEVVNWRGADWTHVQAARDPGKPSRLQAQGPGGFHIDATAAPDAKGVWRGKGELGVADWPGFAATVHEGGANLPFRKFEAGGDFVYDGETLALNAGRIALDRAKLSGDLRLSPASNGRRARLVAKLSATALDLAAAPDLVFPLASDADLDMSFSAQAPGDGRVVAHLTRENSAAKLDRFELTHIGGADFSAAGQWGANFAGLTGEARLKASDLTEISQLLARLVPGAATKALLARAKTLAPATLVANIGAESIANLNGALGATKIVASLAPQPDGMRAALIELTAPEGGALLNQLGLPPLTGQKLGPAHLLLNARAESLAAERFKLNASADLAGVHGDFAGALDGGAPRGELKLSGDPVHLLVGLSAGPSRLEAHVEQTDGAIRLQNLSGLWGESKFSGELGYDADGFSGALKLDKLSAPGLVALVLGPEAPAKKGMLLSSLSFAPVMVDPPHARVRIETEDLRPFGARAHFDLVLGPGQLAVSEAEIGASGGVLHGGAELRRSGGQVTLSGHAEAEKITVKNAGFSAALDGKVQFAGSGGNEAALIGSLAGGGAAHLRALNVTSAAPDAPDEALAADAASETPFDAALTAKRLDQAFAKGLFVSGEADLAGRVAEGRLNLAREGLDFTYDLRDESFVLTTNVAARSVADKPPHAGVIWSGPWAAPVRKVDSVALVNFVAVRALEREQARIEKQKADDRERVEKQRAEDRERLEKQKAEDREKLKQLLAPPAIPGQ